MKLRRTVHPTRPVDLIVSEFLSFWLIIVATSELARGAASVTTGRTTWSWDSCRSDDYAIGDRLESSNNGYTTLVNSLCDGMFAAYNRAIGLRAYMLENDLSAACYKLVRLASHNLFSLYPGDAMQSFLGFCISTNSTTLTWRNTNSKVPLWRREAILRVYYSSEYPPYMIWVPF